MKLRLYALAAFGIVVGVAARAPAAYIYWTDSNAWSTGGGGDIRRANLDGTGQTTLIGGLVGPGGIALDAAGGSMYWTNGDIERNTGDIRRANLDGSGQQVLNSALFTVGIALDPGGRKIYWLTHYQSQAPLGLDVRRANLDGSGLEVLVRGLPSPTGIALDLPTGKMYWTDFNGGDIRRANLDGSGQETLVRGLTNFPTGIALIPEPAGLTLLGLCG